jgi:FKBP-type peptidyl-prolyl cis-trans isomerase
MNLNKYEIIGMFLSVGVMALALIVIRFETTSEDIALIDPSTQSAVVVATDSADGELRDALMGATTADGELVELVIDDVRIGDGAEVKEGDTVSVHYIGSTRDGVQFDSSYVRGEPFEFTVGGGQVIEGWEKGLVGMKVGGQRMLVIPAAMAYGNRQVGPIPANSPLVFAIELIAIK